MRNDYGIRPRAKMKKGGKADMITAKMSKKKKEERSGTNP